MMTRQAILRTFSIFCIVLISSISSVCAQDIGLELYSLRNEFKTDVPGTLARIKQWKIKFIEGGGTYGLPVEEFKKLLEKNDLEMVSYGADFDQLSKSPQEVIDKAKAFGSKFIMCSWISHHENDFTIADVKKAMDVFSTFGKMAHENGLKFCYHTHGYEFRPYENGTLFDYMVKNTDPKYVNFQMDVFWVKHPGQYPLALLKKYPNRFLMLHLKDRKPGTEGNQNGHAADESNVALGQGDVGIAAIMKEAKKIGIKYYFIEDESPNSVEQIPESLKFLESIK